jgi:hypothetical protein
VSKKNAKNIIKTPQIAPESDFVLKASVMEKTQSKHLKRALTRYKKRQHVTQLMDHAVPETALFTGVLSSYHLTHKTDIGQDGSLYTSPHVLSLKAVPAPEEIIEDLQKAIYVNFISSFNPEPNRSPIANIIDTTSDLELTPEEIQWQLTQDTLSHHGWNTAGTLAPTGTILEPVFSSITQNNLHNGALHQSESKNAFNSDAFSPNSLPEDIFSYFDFPEHDSPEESDIVSLDEIDVIETNPSQTEIKRRWKLSIPSIPAAKKIHLPIFAHSWQKAIASFVALSFVFVLPLQAMNVVQDLRETKQALESSSQEAISLLSDGAQAALARDSQSAKNNFVAAGSEFNTAKLAIEELGVGTDLLLSILPLTKSTYKTADALLVAGEELAIAGARLSDGYKAMEQELAPTPISRLNILETYLLSAVPHLEKAQAALEDVKLDVLPEEHVGTFVTLQSGLPTLISTIEEFDSFYQLAKTLLGAQGTKRYLVVFQNNTEIRPTGGFIGSFAELKIHDGVIEKLHIPGGGSYDLQGSLKENLIAPEPLQILKARWEFQDANWFPDFPTSARQILQFYESAGGPSVDGVLAINATFVAQLIGLIGSIDMPEYGRVINEDNFIFEAQRIVEYEYDKQINKPKAFIGDLAPKLVEQTIDKTSKDFLAIVDFLNSGLSQKELQLYLVNDEIQKQVIDHGWGGEIKWTNHDYLLVSNTNLGGGKTDGVIHENINLQVDIQDDGSIVNTVTIERTHFGIKGLMFTGVNNVNYTRLYVPKGSELMQVGGFMQPDPSLFHEAESDWILDDDLVYTKAREEIDPISSTRITQEHGKTVFGNWIQTKPGTTSTVHFQYKLPITINALNQNKSLKTQIASLIGVPQTEEYALTIQKQPGVENRETHVTVNAPESLSALWTSHAQNEATFENTTDGLFAILFESL